MKWSLLVCPLILIPLLLANKVSSDTLHDCEDEIKELKVDAEEEIDTLNTMRSSESKARQELHSIKTTIIEVRLDNTNIMNIHYFLIEMERTPPIDNQSDWRDTLHLFEASLLKLFLVQ